MRSGGIVEDLNEGIAGGGFDDSKKVAQAETEGYRHDEPQCAVEEGGGHDGPRKSD